MLRQLRMCLELLQRMQGHVSTMPRDLLHDSVQAELRTLGQRSAIGQRGYARRAGRPPATAPTAAAAVGRELNMHLDTEDGHNILKLPSDLSIIARFNPELHEAMLAHQKQQSTASAKERVVAALERSLPDAKRVPRVTKTSLGKLRLDELRALLEKLQGDSRGPKDALVQRLLAAVEDEEVAAANSGGLLSGETFRPGVVPHSEVRRQRRREQLAAQDTAQAGATEEQLRNSHVRMAVQKAPFHHAFQPQEVADLLAEARADDVCIIDVRASCSFTDYMVVATGRSQRLVHMLASAVLHELKRRCAEVAPGVSPGVEGLQEESEWMVVDAGSVVVHVFLEGYRAEYDLEGLWGVQGGRNITHVAPRHTLHTLHTIS